MQIGLTIALVFALVAIWFGHVKIDSQYVPTIVNGLTSAVALLIGFGVACLTVIRRYHSLVVYELVILWIFVMVPLVLTFGAYGALIFKSDFEMAVRFIFSAFTFSILVVVSVLFLGVKEVW